MISIHAPRVGSDGVSARFSHRHANFNPRSPCGERQQRCIDFSFASSAKRGFFVIFSKLGAIFRGSAEKGGGISFLDRCEPPGGNMGTWRSRSENQGVFGRIGGFTAKVFYFLFVLIAKVVESQAVLFGVHDSQELCLQAAALGCIQEAFKDGILNPLAVVHAFFAIWRRRFLPAASSVFTS